MGWRYKVKCYLQRLKRFQNSLFGLGRNTLLLLLLLNRLTHVSILYQIIFPFRLVHYIEQSSDVTYKEENLQRLW